MPTYSGPIKLVISDLAGTLCDPGPRSSVMAFVELFRRSGIEVSAETVRKFLGRHKRDHLRCLLETVEVAGQFEKLRGQSFTEDDFDFLFRQFRPILEELLFDHCGLIPGAAEVVDELRGRDIKFAADTGYFRSALNIVVEELARQRVEIDVCVASDEVPEGRPAPWMIYRIMEETGVYPPKAVLKAGDTEMDIQEALNAGVWAVGVAETGNLGYEALREAGADFVIASIADLPAVIDQIEKPPSA